MTDFLLLAFIFLIAGVVAVPIASRLGLGSVLGYLIAGIVISPLLALLSVDVVKIQHFAEFGVVMMLFLVGLELEPKLLWEMRAKLLGLGGMQVVGTAAAVMGVAMLLGQPWTIALAIGLVLALSSTAIVLQTLNEKGLMKSDGGQSSFSVLLFQDIAVIPMLALIPLLAMPGLMDIAPDTASATGIAAPADPGVDQGADHGSDHGAEPAHATADGHAAEEDHSGEGGHGSGLSLVDGLPGWAATLVTLAAIGVVILGGVFLTRPTFRFIASAGLRELFTATALMFVIGIALLMSLVGLSPALGTFLAGVVLANSEYRHELESDIDPFRGLLLGLFFMTVGAGIDFSLLGANLLPILGMTLGLIALKAAVLLVLALVFRIQGADRWLFALGLAQAGEFGFVLLSFTVANDVIPVSVSSQLLLVVALSMLLTPALFILHERVIVPRFARTEEREADDIEEPGGVIIAGHGRWGGIVNRMLREAGFSTTVLDYNSSQLEAMRTFGFRVFYGDATRPDLLEAAGLAEARMIVVAIDDRDKCTEIVRYVLATHPKVHVIARARDRHHVYELYAAGCRDIIRETFDSGVRAGRSAFEALGVHPFDAERMSRQFVTNDRDAMRALAEVYDPDIPAAENPAYVAKVKEMMTEREAKLKGEERSFNTRIDRAWSPPTPKDVEAERRAADGTA
ncbi:cation:proton antiporter domain-containing protein [Roseisalinus antarcticus]|uniref:Glutathione-regulated potassium-efflux system protein KefC n=1 Tax=Roseisalinus antarcticus TaxID=254357 RepID=A0A1Y5RQ94_9RHOB|nr:cation:proton antiporter [Roseisalinus antarcticus]SLN22780.1 Glutathione-regulated potassium-efflux system protein KefC [Roseisalinus antarcticus]